MHADANLARGQITAAIAGSLPAWAQPLIMALGDKATMAGLERRLHLRQIEWRLHRLTSMNSVRRLREGMAPCPVYCPPHFRALMRQMRQR